MAVLNRPNYSKTQTVTCSQISLGLWPSVDISVPTTGVEGPRKIVIEHIYGSTSRTGANSTCLRIVFVDGVTGANWNYFKEIPTAGLGAFIEISPPFGEIVTSSGSGLVNFFIMDNAQNNVTPGTGAADTTTRTALTVTYHFE